MASAPETEGISNFELEIEKDVDSEFLDEGPEGLIPRLQTYFRDNFQDIILLTLLTTSAIINFFIEAKLASLDFFFIVILITGHSLGKRFAVLSALLTILIVWAFILVDKTPYLVNYTNDMLNFYMILWSGFLILTGWLGSALGKFLRRKTAESSKG